MANADPIIYAVGDIHGYAELLDDLLAQIDRIRRVPAVIIQGRYDMVCPIRSADALARAWPEAQYIIVRDAGHSAMEPGIREQLVLASERAKGW